MDGIENIFTFIGSFIYKNDILEQISTETGQVLKTENTYKYQYFLKDHLGSIRVMFEDSASTANIIQETHYYPYGMKIAGLSYTSISGNNKLFSSKELQSEMNLNWYDFHARQYMPDLGIFGSFDPMVEAEISNTPYNYCANNPVNYTDPNGMQKVANENLPDIMAIAYDWAMHATGGRAFGSGGGGGGWEATVNAHLNSHGTNGSGASFADIMWRNDPNYYLSGEAEADEAYRSLKSYNNSINKQAQDVVTALQLRHKITFNSDGSISFDKNWISEVYSLSLGNDLYNNYLFNNGVRSDYYYFQKSQSNGDGSGWNTAFNINTGVGVASGTLAGNFGLTANQTLKYAQRVKGKVRTPQVLSRANRMSSLKIARGLGRVNIVTGVIGTAYSANQVVTDYQVGGWEQVNGWDVTDTAVGAAGVGVSIGVAIGIVSNPVGWVVGIGTGLYFGGRLIYDLVTEP